MLTSHAMIVYLTIKTWNFVISNKFPEFDHLDPGIWIELCLYLHSSFVAAIIVMPQKTNFSIILINSRGCWVKTPCMTYETRWHQNPLHRIINDIVARQRTVLVVFFMWSVTFLSWCEGFITSKIGNWSYPNQRYKKCL